MNDDEIKTEMALRIEELEKTLVEIRDRHLKNIESNAHEGDKVICGVGSVRSALARVIPKCDFPETKS